MEALHYPPHITLAIYDSVEPHDVVEVVDSVFRRRESVRIRFGSLDCFETPDTIILWARPQLPDWLRSVHHRIHSMIDVSQCRPHYRPGQWVPHSTLGLIVDPTQRNRALALARQRIEPFEVLFDVADCAAFLPVKVLHEVHLRGA